MNQSLVLSILTYTVVMVAFNIVKDFYIKYNNVNFSEESLKKVNRRWLISYTVGIIILFFVYGCEKERELCDKGPRNTNVVCNEIYQPIRAPDGTIYSNACYAQVDGWDNACLTLVNI